MEPPALPPRADKTKTSLATICRFPTIFPSQLAKDFLQIFQHISSAGGTQLIVAEQAWLSKACARFGEFAGLALIRN